MIKTVHSFLGKGSDMEQNSVCIKKMGEYVNKYDRHFINFQTKEGRKLTELNEIDVIIIDECFTTNKSDLSIISA
jgi:DNA replication protein DnaC